MVEALSLVPACSVVLAVPDAKDSGQKGDTDQMNENGRKARAGEEAMMEGEQERSTSNRDKRVSQRTSSPAELWAVFGIRRGKGSWPTMDAVS